MNQQESPLLLAAIGLIQYWQDDVTIAQEIATKFGVTLPVNLTWEMDNWGIGDVKDACRKAIAELERMESELQD